MIAIVTDSTVGYSSAEISSRGIVARCGETKQADELAALIGHRFAHIHVHRRELGPVLSIHTGEGAFGVAFVTQD